MAPGFTRGKRRPGSQGTAQGPTRRKWRHLDSNAEPDPLPPAARCVCLPGCCFPQGTEPWPWPLLGSSGCWTMFKRK